MKFKLVTGAYVLLLVIIVALADWRAPQPLFAFMYGIPYGDKLGHFFVMGLFSLVLNLSLSCRAFVVRGVRVLKGTLIVLCLVMLEETSQLFIRHRSFDMVDLLFDCLGIFTFDLCARYLQTRANVKRITS